MRSCTTSHVSMGFDTVARSPASRYHASKQLPCIAQYLFCRPISGRARRNLRVLQMTASSSDGKGIAPGMSREEALEVMGLTPDVSFDRIMSTKNKLRQRQSDQGKLDKIDAAYDVLLMDSMKQRMSGSSDVARSVRFADVAKPKKPKQETPRQLPGNIVIAAPANDILLKQSGVFALLVVWTLVQALTAQPSQMGVDTGAPGIQLALSVGASVYFLRDTRKIGLGRAVAITAGGFVAGTLIGAVANNLLRVDIVPLGSFSSPGALVGEFSILGLWAVSSFLR